MATEHTQTRDSQGQWQPDPLPAPGPVFNWPPRFFEILKGLSGMFFHWRNLVYIAIALISWVFFTPDLSRTSTFSIDWIAAIYLRNCTFLILIAGGLHLRLYTKRSQGTKYKYNQKWPGKNKKGFLFRNQTWDNMFWSLVSGCTIWTAYEAITLWAYSNNILPYVSWQERPVYCVLLLLGIPMFRQFHFYWTHRLTHWKPLYKSAHYLHHRNTNPGPWSGLSMHPIEHILYLSGVFIHWIIPSHPLHAVFHGMHGGLSPAAGHVGFGEFKLKENQTIKNPGYFHYLHHRFFECNYGNEGVPLDKWFGSFHDGTPESQAAMRAKRRREKFGLPTL